MRQVTQTWPTWKSSKLELSIWAPALKLELPIWAPALDRPYPGPREAASMACQSAARTAGDAAPLQVATERTPRETTRAAWSAVGRSKKGLLQHVFSPKLSSNKRCHTGICCSCIFYMNASFNARTTQKNHRTQ